MHVLSLHPRKRFLSGHIQTELGIHQAIKSDPDFQLASDCLSSLIRGRYSVNLARLAVLQVLIIFFPLPMQGIYGHSTYFLVVSAEVIVFQIKLLCSFPGMCSSHWSCITSQWPRDLSWVTSRSVRLACLNGSKISNLPRHGSMSFRETTWTVSQWLEGKKKKLSTSSQIPPAPWDQPTQLPSSLLLLKASFPIVHNS